MAKSMRNFQGLPVQDATRDEIIHIKASDLAGGYTRQPNYCAVHHAAMRDLHRKKSEVFVHTSTVFILNDAKDCWIRYAASQALRIQIIVHDQGGTMREGEYKLKRPSPSVRFDVSAEVYARQKRRKAETGRIKIARTEMGHRERPAYTRAGK